MAIEQIVGLLVQERDMLNRAIEALGAPVRRVSRSPKKAASCRDNEPCRAGEEEGMDGGPEESAA